MQIKSLVDLIYIAEGQKDNGSPVTYELTRNDIKCDLMETFSANYYTSNERLMRLSRNIAVPTPLTYDVNENGKRYELRYVKFGGLKYQVRNILKHSKTSLLKILDVQELR